MVTKKSVYNQEKASQEIKYNGINIILSRGKQQEVNKSGDLI